MHYMYGNLLSHIIYCKKNGRCPIHTCAEDIPLGALGGTCIELTFGGRPENNQMNERLIVLSSVPDKSGLSGQKPK